MPSEVQSRPRIENTTNVLQGDGQGNAESSGIIVTPGVDVGFTVNANNDATLSVSNLNSGGSASAGIQSQADVASCLLQSLSSGHSTGGIVGASDSVLSASGDLAISSGGTTMFSIDGLSTQKAVLDVNGFSVGSNVDPGAGIINAFTGFRINSAAASGKVIIGNGTNFIASVPAFPNAASNIGKIIQSDGTNFITSTMAYPTGTAPVAGKFLRSDGTNWIASTPTLPTSAGLAGKILRSDGTNYVESTPTFPNTATSQGAIVGDGTNFVTSGTGTAVTLGTIELGAASDTTLSRAAAGILAVEGTNVITTANIDDTAFAASWDGVTTIAASKNAVYDYLTSIKANADAPAQLVNIAATNAIVSKTGVTVSAGDRFEILCEGAILNNSGATRQYQVIFNFGSLNISATDGAATTASATGRNLRTLRAIVGVKNTSSAWMSASGIGYAGASLGSSGQLTAGFTQGGSQQSSSNLTGSQNINITVAGNVATPTQTFEVTSWRITKLATNP